MQLGEAFVDITAKDNKLVQSLSKAQSKTEKAAAAMSAKLAGIGKGMAIAGAAVTAAFGAIIMKTAQVGDQFDKMSLRTGVTVENLSALAYAADICGTDIGTVEKGLKGLTKTMDDASMGIGEGLEAFELLDIAVVDVEGNLRPTVEVLKEAATKIAAIENPTKQAALAMDLFGAKAGPQLLPLLKQGGDGIEELMEKAEQLGITMSTEAATAAAEFTDRLADLKGSLAGAGREIGNVLIPAITPLIEKVVEIVGKIREWAEAHKPLIETIVKFVAAAGVIMVVLGPILIAIPLLIKAFAGLKVAIIAIKVVMTALTGPIGWIILAVGALALAWTTNFGGIRDFTIAVVGKVTEALGWLWDKVKWVLEKLGLYKETVEEIIPPTNELATATEEAGDKAETAVTGVDNLADSMGGLATKTDDAKEALNEFGEKIETFDEWVKRLEEEATKANKKMADEAETAYNRYADAMQPVEDRLYELSHTEEEVAARNLLKKKESLEESVKAAGLAADKEKAELTKIREWYDQEIGLITTKLEEQQNALIETAKTTETSANTQMAAIREIKNEYGGLIERIKEVGKAAAKIASEMAMKKWEAENPITLEQIAATEAQAEAYKTPSYAAGTPYVPRTELAMVHKGEKITPANQNTNNNSYSPSIVVNISGDGNASEIKEAVEQALQESARQYSRSGNVLISGMA